MGDKTRKWFVVIFILAVLGIVVTLYLTYVHIQVNGGDQGYTSICNINEKFNCDAVATSEWSRLFGVPTSVWGMGFYLFFALFAGLKIFKGGFERLAVYFFWTGTLGVVLTLRFIYVSKVVLQTWCLFCVVSWVLTALIFFCSVAGNTEPLRRHPLIFWQDLCWWIMRPWRVVVSLVLLVVFLLSVGAAWNREKQRLAQIQKNAPQFRELTPPVSLEGHAFGSNTPQLTIVEFSDYQCPHCKHLYEELKKLSQEFPGLKVIHKDYPMDHQCNPAVKKPFHTAACSAALFVRCAGEQGRSAEAVDLVFAHQTKLKDPEILKGFATQLGLVPGVLDTCLQDPRIQDALAEDIQEGIKHRFRGTPIIIFDGVKQLESNWSGGRLRQMVKEFLNQ